MALFVWKWLLSFSWVEAEAFFPNCCKWEAELTAVDRFLRHGVGETTHPKQPMKKALSEVARTFHDCRVETVLEADTMEVSSCCLRCFWNRCCWLFLLDVSFQSLLVHRKARTGSGHEQS